MGHTITDVRTCAEHWEIEYFDDTDTGRERGYTVAVPFVAVPNRMGAYDITDPAEALESVVHEWHWSCATEPGDHRDDPATVRGWVTTTGSDAEPIHLYNARSAADAAGAHRARLDAARAAIGLRDPDGRLPSPVVPAAEVQYHREMTDTLRWVHVYGGLPDQPRPHRRRSGIPLEVSRA